MASMAAGLSMEVLMFTYIVLGFPTRCLEQIRNDISYHGAQ